VSVLFLASYLTYHFHVPTKKFAGEGPVRIFYYGMLLTHTVLASAVPFLALYTLIQGFRDRLAAHVRVARWTLPIWLYVSVTGVGVYLMLYHLFASPARV
jgi:putative membrane protein